VWERQDRQNDRLGETEEYVMKRSFYTLYTRCLSSDLTVQHGGRAGIDWKLHKLGQSLVASHSLSDRSRGARYSTAGGLESGVVLKA